MSGDAYNYEKENHKLTKDNFKENLPGSLRQLDGLGFGQVVNIPEFDGDKILTPSKQKKLAEKYLFKVDKFTKYSKYNFYALNLGIVAYDKLKPAFKADLSQTKPRGSKATIFIVRNTSAATLAEAKKLAKEFFFITGETEPIYRRYTKNNQFAGNVKVGAIVGEKTGETKTKPQKKSATMKIVPRYLYIFDFVLSDHEYDCY